jgi:arabinofuranosyltransferase
MGYYGAFVPTTAIAKEASEAWWSQGRLYLADLLQPYRLAIPLGIASAILLTGAWRSVRHREAYRLLVASAPVVAGLADGLYVVRVGGDFMHGRLLLPALFAVLMPLAVVEARPWWRSAAVALLLPWALVCLVDLRLDYVVNPNGITDERAFYAISAEQRNPIQVGDFNRMLLYADGQEARRLHGEPARRLGWITHPDPPAYTSMPLRDGLPIRTAFVARNLGITGLLAAPSIHIVDPSGLADPLASRVQLQERGRPGHEKHLPLAWVVARFGDPRHVPEGVDPGAVEAARRALQCSPLSDLLEATTAPLTPARFMRNIRLSIRLHDLRIPPDPVVAEARFCGH